mmetsp:Transcript_15913/g.33281  ORF Transcript_15913/g.33281 Transcript_15913/m.33281 type:complete len:419 (-) Transcript_15913:47-1303(-)
MDASDSAQNLEARPRDETVDSKGVTSASAQTSNDTCAEGDKNNAIQNTFPSPTRAFSSVDNLVISPASSSLGASPPHDFTSVDFSPDDDEVDAPMNPFRLTFDREGNNFDTNTPFDSAENIDVTGGVEGSDRVNESIENDANNGRESPTHSLNLSVLSGYDTEEDEDGVLRRYGNHVLASTKNAIAIMRSDDEEDSVYSAVNQSTDDIEDNNMNTNGNSNGPNRARIHSSQSSLSRSSSTSGSGRRKSKGTLGKIRGVINGMRRAHEDARLHRSTRRFLAMSEGQRTAQGWTESICLSPWCDITTGRGIALMFGALTMCVLVASALGKGGHLTWGIWIIVIGAGTILMKVFWVPIHWLAVGQFLEKRRRQNMQVYETLNGGNPGGIEIPVQNVNERDEYSFENELARQDTEGSQREVV